MTSLTSNLSLILYNSTTDGSALFSTWRADLDGNVSSNMLKIDAGYGVQAGQIAALQSLSTIIPVSATYVSSSLYTATVSQITTYSNNMVIALSLNQTSPGTTPGAGTTTLTINALANTTLVKADSTGAFVNLSSADLVKNRIYLFKYNLASTVWVWMNATSLDQITMDKNTAGNVLTVSSTNGIDASLTQSLMISQTVHAATGKSTPASADELFLVDTAASNVTKKITWSQILTNLTSSLGALINGGTSATTMNAGDILGFALVTTFASTKILFSDFVNQIAVRFFALPKTTPVGADTILITDSAGTPTNTAKSVSFTNIIAYLKTAIATDTLASPTDITTNNASTSFHGFLRKLSGNLADSLRGDGTWGGVYLPDGVMQNGQLNVTVSSNNITVALKTLAGNNPSASDPIYVRINGVIRSITSALSVTKNAGTNWFNSGSTEMAASEIDYFVYLGYNATNGVVIGFARIPYGVTYNDFSATSTNEKYCAISTITTAASTDSYVNIGRFAASLSATASFNWSVPTFTNANLINRPIMVSRILTYTTQITYTGGTTDPTSNVPSTQQYYLNGREMFFNVISALTIGTGNRTSTRFSLPFTPAFVNPISGAGTIVTAAFKAPTAIYTNVANIIYFETMAATGTYYINGSCTLT